jgi:transposase
MEDYIRVRRMHFEEGFSVRAIARKTGLHRKTVQKMIIQGVPPGYQPKTSRPRPRLGPFLPRIDQILAQDKQAPPKQRHTAQRIFDRLRQEFGYTGGYTQVKDYVRQARQRQQEAYVPLDWPPGQAQVDWGEAWVIQAGRPLKAQMFVMTLPFSDARFVASFPRASLEFFLEGHRQAFSFFGGVPARIVYDNLKSAVIKVGRGRRRDLNTTFEQFCEQCLFTAAFCNVARGNEKGHVENGVGWVRRNMFVPQPAVGDWQSFNEHLAQECRRPWPVRLRGHERTVGERLREEQASLRPVPQPPVRPLTTWGVNSLCLVRFDLNDYSVPCRWAYHPVLVRADVGRVRIFHEDRQIAEHVRCFGREQAIYEPWHYLALIERKPRALDWGAPMKELKLEACFEQLRRQMEDGQEHSRGTRAYIGVLRLLEQHSLEALTRAVRRALELGAPDKDSIRNLLLCPPERLPGRLDLSGRMHLATVQVPLPDLSVYGALAAAQGGRS